MRPRNLRMRGEWVPSEQHVKVTLLDREPSDELFGGNKRNGDEYFFGSGCCLIPESYAVSINTPSINSDDHLLDVVIGGLGSTFTTSDEHWQLIKEGIREYNAWAASKEEG